MKKKISNRNKLIIITIGNLIFLIAYTMLCYVYPQCIKDAIWFIQLMVMANIVEYTFLNDLRLNTARNIIEMDGDE